MYAYIFYIFMKKIFFVFLYELGEIKFNIEKKKNKLNI